MADIVWPPGLPQAPQLSTISEQPPDLAMRSTVDRGPDKLRLRSLALPTRFTISVIMTRTQAATFDAFYRTSTAGGTLPFEWKHPRTGNLIDYRFLAAPRIKQLAPRQVAGTEKVRVEFDVESLPGTEQIAPPSPPPPPPPPPPGGEVGGLDLWFGDIEIEPEIPLEGEGFIVVPFPQVAAPGDILPILFGTLGADVDGELSTNDDNSLTNMFGNADGGTGPQISGEVPGGFENGDGGGIFMP